MSAYLTEALPTFAPSQSTSTVVPQLAGHAGAALRRFVQESAAWDANFRPTPKARSTASVVAGTLDRLLANLPPHIAPSGYGGLQFEFRNADQTGRRELDIEVLPDGSIGYLVAAGENDLADDLPPSRLDSDLKILLTWLIGD